MTVFKESSLTQQNLCFFIIRFKTLIIQYRILIRRYVNEVQKTHIQQMKFTLQPRGFLSYLFFGFILKILKQGYQTPFYQQSMPNSPKNAKQIISFQKFSKIFNSLKQVSLKGSLVKSIFSSEKSFFLKIILLSFLSVIFQMFIPVISNYLIDFLSQSQQDVYQLFGYLLALAVSQFLYTLAQAHCAFNMGLLGILLSNNLKLLIVQKANRYASLYNKSYDSGKLITLTQVDASRFGSIMTYLRGIIFFPIQIVIGLILLFLEVGPSFLSGLAVFGLVTWISVIIGKKAVIQNQNLLKFRDDRINRTKQLSNNIFTIKSNSFEEFVRKKLDQVRQNQLQKLKAVGLLGVLNILSYWICPTLILSLTFITFNLTGGQITASKAFSVVMIFNIIQQPMRSLSVAVNLVIQLFTSLRRIEQFLLFQQLDLSYITHSQEKQASIEMCKGSFEWMLNKSTQKGDEKEKAQAIINSQQNLQTPLIQKQNDQFKTLTALQDISFRLTGNKLVLIYGKTKSGKSSLLYSLLGQMKRLQGTLNISGKISFCPQKPWILNRTAKQNILMSSQIDLQHLMRVVECTSLTSDINILQAGLQTQIGQKGVNLSGGQKARISLARAVYRNCDIYLLDDVLSAVDVHVSKHIVQECLLGLLKDKMRILVTHNMSIAKRADHIFVMDEGRIVQQGDFQSIKGKPVFCSLYKEDEHKEKQDEKKGRQQQLEIKDKDDKAAYMDQEERFVGKVPFSTYFNYFKEMGGIPYLIIIMTFIVFANLALVYSNYLIVFWCESPERGWTYLIWYVVITSLSACGNSMRAYLLVFGTIKVGSKLHSSIMNSVLYTNLTWWNMNPIGRIINRLSKDLTEIDQNIGFVMGSTLVNIVSLLFTLAVCVIDSSPFVILPSLVCLVLGSLMQRYYIPSQRQLTRLKLITNSPTVSRLNQLIEGSPIIRSLKNQPDMFRNTVKSIEINNRANFTSFTIQIFFQLVLQFLSYLVCYFSIGYAVLGTKIDANLAGMLLVYATNLNVLIVNTIRLVSQLQKEMVSYQRLGVYQTLQKQQEGGKPDLVYDKGEIQFHQVGLKYKQQGLPILSNLTFRIPAGSKVGIVGRTGAGKTSLFGTILRLYNIFNGHIKIDGINIQNISLNSLRENITVISQQPVLLEGTIRDNLNPFGKYTDDELMDVIRTCCLQDLLRLRNGLQTVITQNGGNLSVGERQLLSLARAIVKKTKIVLMDQATANIDVTTQQKVQQTMRTKFKDCTVLTIAHRLNTIMNSDLILVLQKGQLIEMGSPSELRQKRGHFWSMINQ